MWNWTVLFDVLVCRLGAVKLRYDLVSQRQARIGLLSCSAMCIHIEGMLKCWPCCLKLKAASTWALSKSQILSCSSAMVLAFSACGGM